MAGRDHKVETFRALHARGCFIIPNPWDVGSAQILTGLGFKALATTSSGYAFSQGKRDATQDVGVAETLAYAARIAHASDLPVTADLDDAVERVGAAVEACRRHNLVLTARADGLGKRAYDLDEAIRRLRAFDALGADVVYAPGVPDLDGLGKICAAVRAPVNHVIGQGLSGVSLRQIADVGVRRVSLGGSLARAAGDALVGIGRQVAGGDFSCLDAAPPWDTLRASVNP